MTTLTAEIPDQLATQLATAADRRGLSVEDLLTVLDGHVETLADLAVQDLAHREVLAAVTAATAARSEADRAWRAAIATAAAAGAPRTRIAQASGVTRQWVSAIARDHRADESPA